MAIAREDSASHMPEQSNDYRVAVFGAGGVGKSSIILRFIKGEFNDNYNPTIEDTYRTVIGCSSDKQKNVCTMQITDSAGSHQFPAMQRLAISKGHAFLLVYSVTNKQTLEELGPVIQLMKECKGARLERTPIVLVGNKQDDAAGTRQVSAELGQKLANNWNCGFIETSAKSNTNIKECFQMLLEREKTRTLTLNIDDGGKAKKKCVLL